VLYTYASGIDQPLEVVRPGVSSPFVVVPHTDWSGQYDVVTYTGSAYGECGIQFGYGLGSGGICFPFELPAQSAYGDVFPRKPTYEDPGIRSWSGSLMQSGRDASGLLYRRNRYLDPKSGRFTQEDPIGLAGGLNLFGYANGDPVNFGDPFGLKVCFKANPQVRQMSGSRQVGTQVAALEQATGSTIALDSDNCIASVRERRVGSGFAELRRRLQELAAADEVINITFYPALWGDDQNYAHGGGRGTTWGLIEMSPNLGRYPARVGPFCTRQFGARSSYAAVLAHELLGHSYYQRRTGRQSGESYAIAVQNIYHSQVGERQRCTH
jgi:RHS repeat-associated protein